MEKLLRDKRVILLFVGPALVVYILVLLVPMLSSFGLSLFKWNALSTPKFTGLSNFIYMFTQDQLFPLALRNGFIILLASLVGEQLLGFFLAAALMSRIRFKNTFRNIYFLPEVLASVAVGMMWAFIYNPKFGLINSTLSAVGLGGLAQNWLTDQRLAIWSISFVVVWQYFGYSLTLFYSAMQGIPESLYDAATVDGASSWKVLWHITLPLIRPIIKANTILITIGSLKFFDLVFVMTHGGPAHATDVLASQMYNESFRNFRLGYGDALSVVLLGICLLLTFVINKSFKFESVEF
jgi:raffinose/stachyose/melibiose transport system permease protein